MQEEHSEERNGFRLAPASPGDTIRRMVRVLVYLFLAMGVVAVLWFLSTALTSFTLRVLVGLVLAGTVGWLGISYFRQVGNPPPPDPVPTDVSPSLHLAYVCEMCGLELAVLKIARDRAPKHCGEKMLLVRQGPSPEWN